MSPFPELQEFAAGTHTGLWRVLGSHVEGTGVRFAVWAPRAASVGVIGDFNDWDGSADPLTIDEFGVWHGRVDGIGDGTLYQFEIIAADGERLIKSDPFAQFAQHQPQRSSVVHTSSYSWGDEGWMTQRSVSRPFAEPFSVYEVHLGSWKRNLSYRQLAEELVPYVRGLGFTHVELMPVMEHPFTGSWGYQVTGYFAPTSRLGDPDDFRTLVDAFHQSGIGVIIDWVPAHFPKDEWALGTFDGQALYEPDEFADHPDWGTNTFDLTRPEVRNFLLSNALYWFEEFHVDGLRVDAVASMLYLDYSREEGEWTPNKYGGRENLEAVQFLQEMNATVYKRTPGVTTIAEESTSWPQVTGPTSEGGLGFGFKWNMGWMHDTLEYFSKEPVHRRFHHHELTFSMVYAWNENFVLPLSHDEVVHGKRSLLGRMPGDRWQRFANLRALYGYMWAHPGKQLLFMGCEFAQEKEWSEPAGSLDWHLLDEADHHGVLDLIRDLNRVYDDEPALWELDHSHEGFRWLEPNGANENVLAFARRSENGKRWLVCAGNFSPVVREGWRLGLPAGGTWREALNTDSRFYGGSDVGNGLGLEAEKVPWNEQDYSVEITLPPLGVVWLVPDTK